MILVRWLLLLFVSSAVLHAGADALLVPPIDAVRAGEPVRLRLYLNNPTSVAQPFSLPATMTAEFAGRDGRMVLHPRPTSVSGSERIVVDPFSFVLVELVVDVPPTAVGNVSMRLLLPQTNPVMFAIAPALANSARTDVRAAAENTVTRAGRNLDLDSDREAIRRHISGYQPIYFAVGFNERTTARFQYSFKYRVSGGNTRGILDRLYFAFTQTSLWDLESSSKPFYDTSYKPTLFYYRETFHENPERRWRFGLQAGIEHESNGRGGNPIPTRSGELRGDSRSLNSAYVIPTLTFGEPGGWQFTVAPRLIAYLEKEENPDLPRYRGNVEVVLRFGKDTGFQISAYLRKGNDSGYGSSDWMLSLPLRDIPGVPDTAGGYLLMQYFNGWGESLLDYDQRRADQLRFGYMIVR